MGMLMSGRKGRWRRRRERGWRGMGTASRVGRKTGIRMVMRVVMRTLRVVWQVLVWLLERRALRGWRGG